MDGEYSIQLRSLAGSCQTIVQCFGAFVFDHLCKYAMSVVLALGSYSDIHATSNDIPNYGMHSQCVESFGSRDQTITSPMDIIKYEPLPKICRSRVSKSCSLWIDIGNHCIVSTNAFRMAHHAVENVAFGRSIFIARYKRSCCFGCAQVCFLTRVHAHCIQGAIQSLIAKIANN
jgi:hypothetical protein